MDYYETNQDAAKHALGILHMYLGEPETFYADIRRSLGTGYVEKADGYTEIEFNWNPVRAATAGLNSLYVTDYFLDLLRKAYLVEVLHRIGWLVRVRLRPL